MSQLKEKQVRGGPHTKSVLAIGILAMELLARHTLAGTFQARGNEDERHVAPPNKEGEVGVSFDTLPTRMSFDLPGHIKMITENGIPYINGATETYIPGEGFHEGASYESWNDTKNRYSRMWVESQNDARIVVRHRCALIKGDKICHQDKKQVASYGPGDWTDEWYVFHPDGTHIQRIKIWSAVARDAGRHGQARFPYELEGAYLWWGAPCKGKMASDHLEDGVITLVKMDGTHKTINFNKYPVKMNDFRTMYRAYGKFKDANIHVVNTRRSIGLGGWDAGPPPSVYRRGALVARLPRDSALNKKERCMKTTGLCPKCESNDIRRIPGDLQSKIGIPTGALSWVPVTRYICTKCGFTEQYVDSDADLQKLMKAYKE